MRGLDNMLCASPASTAICVSIDHKSMVQQGHSDGGRAIDRYNPLLLDHRRVRSPKSCPNNTTANTTTCSTPPISKPNKPSTRKQLHQKSSNKSKNSSSSSAELMISSPPGSTRYLLSDSPFSDHPASQSITVTEFDLVSLSALTCTESTRSITVKQDESAILNPSTTAPIDQVVVLRVSLHCKGCEAKVRKHISRMQGVKSYNIDFRAKKVTVVGNVTPAGVLNSISKVKNAQLWPPSPSS